MFDYHIHSDFSADCNTPMENTIEQAYRRGLKEICFTEHIDDDYPDPSIEFTLDHTGYDKKISALKAQYQGEISVKKGVEIGIQPHLLMRMDELLKKETFDFVICSMHTTAGKDLHSGDFFREQSVEAAYQQYYEELLACIHQYKNFDILGHIDLVKRYAADSSGRGFHEIIREIFREIIPDGKGIELNTSGVRYGMESGMPSEDILRLYRDCCGEVITVGSDAHKAADVGYQVKESYALLQSLGFRYIATFDDRKPVFHRIGDLV
ncbi:histidinol-phosphatase HisJ family protein [Lentibacillus sediminis]|uniref:histidinol-phosphatase HisJ family protein n=1 Tax=Lentibacillus sediminis TaxID=1940529 RepID=UPI000C1C469E|nr:histidinol-phosphatase HisJ family protein [Lentibacillus sediminis]